MKDYVLGFQVCHNRGMKQKFKTITSETTSRSCKFMFWKGNSVKVLNI